MALIALTTADKVNVGSSGPNFQHSAPCAEAITAGAPVLFDTTGKLVNADANGVGLRAIAGVATRSGGIGDTVTFIRQGFITGLVLDAVPYGTPVYVSDTVGRLDTVAGTLSMIVGYVWPVWGQGLGVAADKMLYVEPQMLITT